METCTYSYIPLQYLGELEEEGVASLEDDETTPTLPLLCVPNRVLFPQETLPMHVYNTHVRDVRSMYLLGWCSSVLCYIMVVLQLLRQKH